MNATPSLVNKRSPICIPAPIAPERHAQIVSYLERDAARLAKERAAAPEPARQRARKGGLRPYTPGLW